VTGRTEFSTSDPDDEVFTRILDELGCGHDPADIERRICAEFPDLAGKIGRFIARHRLLELATDPEEEEDPVPDRLGDFTIVREIGRGGTGMIYAAVQEPFRRRAALKTIRGEKPRSPITWPGRFRGCPGRPAMEGAASTNGTVRFASGVLAGTVSTTKGTPWASVPIACWLPGRERSTGLGPVSSPPPTART
jgi:hypothetical protein